MKYCFSATPQWSGKYWVWCATLLGGATVAQAQQTERVAPYIVGAYAQGSFIMAHTPAITHLAVSHPTGVELNLQRQTTGTAPWHAWYRYPKVGLALVYYDYHNPMLGQSFAATAYINKAIWRTARQELNFRLGTGLGYFTTSYDRYDNKKNEMIGSRLNATIQTRVEYDVAVSDHLGLLMGVAFNHYSNGATTKPNRGINLPSVVLGVNYHQQRAFQPQPDAMAAEPDDIGRFFVNLSTSYAFKQLRETDQWVNRRYSVFSATVAVGKRLNRKSNLMLGLEGFQDQSLRAAQRMDGDTTQTGGRLPDIRKAGVYIGHELLFGRLAFVSHLGVYIYNPYKSNPFYYERLGLKYHFTKRVFGDVDLKVHRAAADALELRVGVKL
ncbi:acyloxyacyl hydrolase [Hymenobacter sp. BT507]|uniref:Acyloxyacyl hydrolase n=1 Tax=Hymenobacter citatus TaxID=2763506 RepID=A0ABR7MQD3_9BACT|nr:acyloxyacyl hydrolase [Hymenobacter citatus]MBC6613124.1 acyloxyacyl hydrolase [Hymenobacter citatus]